MSKPSPQKGVDLSVITSVRARHDTSRTCSCPHRLVCALRKCLYRTDLAGVLVLIAGAILAPGRRTVTSALSIMGLREIATFTTFHRVLNRNRWAPREIARRLLHQLVDTFVPEGPVVIAIDETIERRWGARIRARGIYRDPVRSSHGHFIKASGLRWVSLMLLAPIPWAGRVWALPARADGGTSC
jgi:hypothetical protein